MGKLIPSDHYLWTRCHAKCSTPWTACEPTKLTDFTVRYECGVVELKGMKLSYVSSSLYESETPVQEAERRIREAQRALNLAQNDLQKAKKYQRFPNEPRNGSVIKFEKRYNGPSSTPYYFAALRVGGEWFLTGTGSSSSAPKTWQELKDFIGDGKFWIPRYFDEGPAA